MSRPAVYSDTESKAVERGSDKHGAADSGTADRCNQRAGTELAQTFIERLRLDRLRRAKQEARRSSRSRNRLLASASPIPCDEDALLPWPDLPRAIRADDPVAAFEASAIRSHNTPPDAGVLAGEFDDLLNLDGPSGGDLAMAAEEGPCGRMGGEETGGTGRAPDGYDRGRGDPSVARPEARVGPIAVETLRMFGSDEGRCTPTGSTDRTTNSVSCGPAANWAGALTTRRYRAADPTLLTPGTALVAAMLARALSQNTSIARKLAYAAPVVIVRSPEGVPQDAITHVIEQCLTEWPVRRVEKRGCGNTDPVAVPGAGLPDAGMLNYRSRNSHYSLDNDDEFAGPPLGPDDAVPTGPFGSFLERSINTIDATLAGKTERVRSSERSKWAATIGTLQSRMRTVIVHAAHDTDLPPDVLALADGELVLAMPDKPVMRLVIEAVTGERIDALPAKLFAETGSATATDPITATDPVTGPSAVTGTGSVPRTDPAFSDVVASLSPLRGAAGSIRRLARITQSRAKRTDRGVSASSEDTPALDDLAGYGTAKNEGLAIADDLRAYHAGTIGWSSVARGLVLAGPPGTGKSLYARALAKSAGVPLIHGSFAAWQASGTGHLGDMLAAMRKCFEDARKAAPCLLFIDELDSVGDRGTFTSPYRDYHVAVVNALLELLDGAVDREGVVVIGATNHPQAIDPAILRPGRLERVVRIGLPDMDDLVGMLRTHVMTVPTDETADDLRGIKTSDLLDDTLRPVARLLRGRTGADVAALVRRARGKARREGRPLSLGDLKDEAKQTRGVNLPAEVLHRTSVHEAGHAVVAHALGVGRVASLSLDPDGGTAWIDMPLNEQLRSQIEDRICFTLAGRAAEIEILGQASAGSGGTTESDLARATRDALRIHTTYGLGGDLVWLGPCENERQLRNLMDTHEAEVRTTLQQAHDRAAAIVRSKKATVETIAERLRTEGYLKGKDLTRMLDDRP